MGEFDHAKQAVALRHVKQREAVGFLSWQEDDIESRLLQELKILVLVASVCQPPVADVEEGLAVDDCCALLIECHFDGILRIIVQEFLFRMDDFARIVLHGKH